MNLPSFRVLPQQSKKFDSHCVLPTYSKQLSFDLFCQNFQKIIEVFQGGGPLFMHHPVICSFSLDQIFQLAFSLDITDRIQFLCGRMFTNLLIAGAVVIIHTALAICLQMVTY